MEVYHSKFNFASLRVTVFTLLLATTQGKVHEDLTPRNYPCPQEEEIAPACTCTSDVNNNLDLDCSGAHNETELAAAFANCISKFPFVDFRNFHIIHDGSQDLTSLSSETFCLATFENIYISGTKIQVIQEDVFHMSHDALVVLNLDNNQLNSLPFETLQLYTLLEELSIENNQVPFLPQITSSSINYINVNGNPNLSFNDDVFSELPSLETLDMDDINLQSINPGAFHVSKLASLSLNNNELTSLVTDAINSSSNSLSFLELNNNNIISVEVGAIQGAKEGLILKMVNNELVDIEQTVWEPLFQEINYNGIIDLSDNPINCGCDIEWLVDSASAMSVISDETTCYGGTQKLSELPAVAFDYHC